MRISLNGFSIRLTLRAFRHGDWLDLPEVAHGDSAQFEWQGLNASLVVHAADDRLDYRIELKSPFATRLRLWLECDGELGQPFHLIPGNIHGDNNAAHVKTEVAIAIVFKVVFMLFSPFAQLLHHSAAMSPRDWRVLR